MTEVDDDPMMGGADGLKKPKTKRPKKKSVLEDDFPPQLQEAFFGQEIIARSRCADIEPLADTPIIEDLTALKSTLPRDHRLPLGISPQPKMHVQIPPMMQATAQQEEEKDQHHMGKY